MLHHRSNSPPLPRASTKAMELWRPKTHQMGRSSKSNVICKKHPKHHQSPGVCSICLSEKLSQLISKDSRGKKNSGRVAANSCCSSSLSSSPSECSSCASSDCLSPVRGRRVEIRSGSLIFSRAAAGRNELIKSRSMAAVTRRIREREGMNLQGTTKNKSNFWSKLLRPRGRS